MGSLHLILGPMFSGKTTRLIQIYNSRNYIGKKVAVINFSEDTRYDLKMLSTHDTVMIPCIQCTKIETFLSDYQYKTYDTILINEGQFFPDLYHNVLKLVEIYNKEVYICGLDGDYLRGTFGSILELIPFCDTVEKLSSLCANCRDGTHAIFSYRITQETEQMVIGVSNYKPLCRKCYLENISIV